MRQVNIIIITLLMLTISQALTIDVNTEDTNIDNEQNLTINYELKLDESTLTNYSIYLSNDYNEYLILNKSQELQEISETITYNTSNMASGDYNLELRVNNPSISINKKNTNQITIQQKLNYQANIPTIIYVTGNESKTDLLIINKGNTNLSISAYFLNTETDISLKPQSFKLERGANKTITATIKAPSNDYNTILVINSISDSLKKEYNITITKPIINLTLNNLEVKQSTNQTFIESVIKNNGNKDVNATINIRTFRLTSGFNTTSQEIIINENSTINHTIILPKGQLIKYELNYNNGTNDLIISEEFSVLSSIPASINLSSDKLILIGIVIILIVIVIYNKLFGRRRP